MEARASNIFSFRRALVLLPLFYLLLSLFSCSGDPSGKPASSNRPYQVLLIGDSENIVYRELADTVPALPQPEPSFDVTTAGRLDEKSPWQQLTRSIVEVKFDKDSAGTRIAVRRDVYAKPQIVLTITAPSPQQLRAYLKAHPRQISGILNAFETGCAIRSLKSAHNPQAEKKVKDAFGIDMLIPADMNASKTGKDFLWLSNNTNEGLQNICIYRVKNVSGGASPAAFRHIRDSVMKINIPGELDGMYMETASVTQLSHRSNQHSPHSGGLGEAYFGLWSMHGDAMGGPFAATAISRPPYTIYIEGFVYAPEGKKRNKLRRLEAVLLTAKLKGVNGS